MIIRWISLVPSKIVKILAVRAVSTGQRPPGPRVPSRYVAKSLIDRVEHCDGQLITPSKALSLTR
jgi:hypothetical protein